MRRSITHSIPQHPRLGQLTGASHVLLSLLFDHVVWRLAVSEGAEELLSFTDPKQHQWVASGRKHEIDLYTLHEDDNKQNAAPPSATFVPAFLGVGVVHSPPLAVLELLSNSERKMEYDEIFESALTVHRHDDVTAVERHSYWTPSRLLIAARDLCLLGHAAMLADGTLILYAKSVQFDELGGEVRPGWTRAQVHIGGFIVQPLTSAANPRSVVPLDAVRAYEAAVAALLAAPACRLTFVARCDLKGALPAPLRKKLCERQPLMIHHIDRVLNKRQARADRAHKQQLYESKLRTLPVYAHLTCAHTMGR